MSYFIPTPKILATAAVIPVMAALPYEITGSDCDPSPVHYNPLSQLTVFARGRYSTCRYDESVGGFLSKSRSDTQQDD
jgi:hypothetical protein